MSCANPYWLEASGDRRFFVGCNQCLYCKMQRRRTWVIRILHEQLYHDGSCFITLTYEREPPRGLVKKHLQNFFKRLRKEIYPRKIKYFACGEYGEQATKRSHYHSIILGLSEDEFKCLRMWKEPEWDARQEKYLYFVDVWKEGITDVGSADPDSIRYVAGYIDKKWMSKDEYPVEYGGRIAPFQIQSAGIGLSWVNDNVDVLLRGEPLMYRGKPQPIPKYYMDKLQELSPFFGLTRKVEMAEESKVSQADVVLEVDETLGGATFNELTEEERNKIRGELVKRGRAMQNNLRAQAETHKLKKIHRRI